ncbi:hypothetical protein DPMN_069528 [Dreissena polymorpha]|uniref:Uncharacterized protein n=1 Tax=Dreissena polymorpha TaxID=45954 RepID=A0A9D3Z1B1_DREPO|nr:hypothetical protein DPMN_069528 [Dreissena polymorpha]
MWTIIVSDKRRRRVYCTGTRTWTKGPRLLLADCASRNSTEGFAFSFYCYRKQRY